MDELRVKLAIPLIVQESYAMAYLGGTIDLNNSLRQNRKTQRRDNRNEKLRGLDEDFTAVSKREAEDSVIFARVAEGMAGYIWFSAASSSGVTCIDELFVKPAFRELGIGRRLVDAVVYASRIIGNKEVEVAASQKSRGFYKKMGFVPDTSCKDEMHFRIVRDYEIVH